MNIKIDFSITNLLEFDADTYVVNLFENINKPSGATAAVDHALGGLVSNLVSNGDFKGKLGETVVMYPQGRLPALRVILVGLGDKKDFKLEAIRKASAEAVKLGRALNAQIIATIVHGGGEGGVPFQEAVQATIEGAMLALYRYDEFGEGKDKINSIKSLNIVEYDPEKKLELRNGIEAAENIIAGVTLARDLVNMPPNIATPTKMAEIASDIANKFNQKLTIGDKKWAAEHNMGAFLAVASGAGEAPKFIVLEHNSSKNDLETLVLVGKGITFDTGGISIKPSEKMEEMKSDMAGAAAVLGTMLTVGMFNLPLRIIGIAPCTENMPDANSFRPADVVTSSNGKTIEIISTDAEGRLVLADALVYAGKFNPNAVIDLATLTGACIVALGMNIAGGLFCNDNHLQEKLVQSGEKTNERLWPLPLWQDYRQSIKSNVADMKNSGGRYGGVGTSAIFLKEFIVYPWAHIDMAGMVLSEKESYYYPEGATGFGVRLLVDFLRRW